MGSFADGVFMPDSPIPLELPLLGQSVDRLKSDYQQARPWPHVVLQDAWPADILDAVAAECAAMGDANLVRSDVGQQVKQEAWSGFGPATAAFLSHLQSRPVVDLVSGVTGVGGLIPDPTHRFAGVHRTPRGGLTKIHRDFHTHPETGLFHRVNLLVYLNRNWPDEYGGSLELWPSDMSALGRRVFPRFNTTILWETHDATLHGLPDPVNCPPERMRLSVAAYYYTKEGRGEGQDAVRYWFSRPGEGRWIEAMPWQDRLRDAIPKRLRSAVRSRLRRPS
jgi:2OG-Fe(II) oxygenase superfamily